VRSGASARRDAHHANRRAGSVLTSSPTPHVRVPRHIARLVTRLVVDYVARPGASARRVAHHATRHAGSSSTTSATLCVQVPRHVARLITRLVASLVVDYFACATCPSASARRAAHHAAHYRLLRAP
jgi:hypothetical protein